MAVLPPIDRLQWRALAIASLKSDVRSGGRTFNLNARGGGVAAFAGSLVLFAVMGVGVSVVVAFCPDVYLAATAYLSALAFIVGSSLLIEHQGLLLSAADYQRLAFQPVSPATFLAARLASLAVYVLAATAAFSAAPLAAFAWTGHGGVRLALVAAAAASATALSVMLVVVILYVGVLRFVPAARLSRTLAAMHLLFGVVVYGSYMAVPMLLGETFLERAALPQAWWTLLNPASWFAALVTLAAGPPTPVTVTGALLSVGALAGSVLAAGGLAGGYADGLAAAGQAASLRASRDRGGAPGPGWLFADREARAVALLVWAQFRYDQRFRLTVLSILPLTLVYLVAGLRTGRLDPFSPGAGEPLVYLAILIFPPLLRGALSQSDAYRAAWIFHAAPASGAALVLAVKRFVAVVFLAPYLGLLGLVYLTVLGRPGPVLVHLVVLGLVSHLVLVCDLALHPDLPFASPARRSGLTATTVASIVIVTFVAVTLHLVLRLAYATLPGTIALVGGLAALNGLAGIALRERLAGRERRAEMEI